MGRNLEFQVKIYSGPLGSSIPPNGPMLTKWCKNMIDQRNNRPENLNKNFARSLESGEKIRSKTAYTVK